MRCSDERIQQVYELLLMFFKSWDDQKYEKLFYHMMRSICCKLSYRVTDDFVSWHQEKSGISTVHSAYKLRMQQRFLEASSGHNSEASNRERSIWNLIWKCLVSLKLRVFAWHWATKSLTVKGSLHRRISPFVLSVRSAEERWKMSMMQLFVLLLHQHCGVIRLKRIYNF
jgi:hypothetical protein